MVMLGFGSVNLMLILFHCNIADCSVQPRECIFCLSNGKFGLMYSGQAFNTANSAEHCLLYGLGC